MRSQSSAVETAGSVVSTGRAAVAAGSAATASAGAEVLSAGGNAVDAAVAAGFAAAVAEPALTSLGGGGFLLHSPASGDPVLVDFFVDAPGRGRPPGWLEPHFLPVTVQFTGAEQVFNCGWGSVAAPGCLDGYLHAHRRFGRLPLADVVAPALTLATKGATLNGKQARLVEVLAPILTLGDEGRAIFAPAGRLLGDGDTVRNEALAAFLGDVAAGRVRSFADLAGPLEKAMDEGAGLVTAADLQAYEVVERAPLRVEHGEAQVFTNPPPSFGGTLITAALSRLAGAAAEPGGLDMVRLAEELVDMSEHHAKAVTEVRGTRHVSVRGTTHVSVVDADGAVASMTMSNGSCSGVYAPGTGVQLNNFMGEADLHPAGFHSAPPGERIGSMMSPSVVRYPDGSVVGLGTGGSERIRSALTRTLVSLLEERAPLETAVLAPRLHWDRTLLQMEPGLPSAVVQTLAQRWPVHEWAESDLYFGGVHAVSRSASGGVAAVGDARRDGTGMVVSQPVRPSGGD